MDLSIDNFNPMNDSDDTDSGSDAGGGHDTGANPFLDDDDDDDDDDGVSARVPSNPARGPRPRSSPADCGEQWVPLPRWLGDGVGAAGSSVSISTTGYSMAAEVPQNAYTLPAAQNGPTSPITPPTHPGKKASSSVRTHQKLLARLRGSGVAPTFVLLALAGRGGRGGRRAGRHRKEPLPGR